MPGLDKLATVHLAVSDSLGDSAIFDMLTVNWLFTMISLIWSCPILRLSAAARSE